jgi:hypothetical protein
MQESPCALKTRLSFIFVYFFNPPSPSFPLDSYFLAFFMHMKEVFKVQVRRHEKKL